MAGLPYGAVTEVLAKGGLEATARSYLSAGGQETVRQVVFQKYPQLPIGEKNYLVGLTNQFLSAGRAQQAEPAGSVLANSAIPVNPGLGGVAGAADRYRYLTNVQVMSPGGGDLGNISVTVYSPIELATADIAAAAGAQVDQWAARYPQLAKYLEEHPVPAGVIIAGVERAF